MLLDKLTQYNPISLILNKLFQKSNLLTELANHYASLFLNRAHNHKAGNYLFLSGVAYLTWKSLKFLYTQYLLFGWLPQHTANTNNFSEQKFKQRYGSSKNAKVLITGGADGIGLAFAKKFARIGFNLILTDINEQKLNRRKGQLQSSYGIAVAVRALDMGDPSKLEEFVREIQGPDGDEIRIIVNNVGMSAGGQYLSIDPKKMRSQINVNFNPTYEINRGMIPKLRKIILDERGSQQGQQNGGTRGPRVAIINIASATGVFYSPTIGAYSAGKHLTDIYSRTLSQENKDFVDIISVRPFGVITSMMHMNKQDRMITPKQCVDATLVDLYAGCTSTFTGARHKMFAGFFRTLAEEEYIPLYVAAFKKKYQ